MPPTFLFRFSWHELMTTDVPAALAFYSKVTGWTHQDSGVPGQHYSVISLGGRGIGGALQLTDEMCANGARTGWMGYIGVDDLERRTAELVAAGGKVLRPMVEIPNMIQFTVVADPHGAAFTLYRGLVPGEQMPAIPPGTLGAFDWNELHAGDGAEAWAFYSRLYGWTLDMTVDMGAHGVYRTFKADGDAFGGMMTRDPSMPVAAWLYYVTVDSITAAKARITDGGGTFLRGPLPVPGGSFIGHAIDPQGGMFGLVSKKE